MFRSGDKVKFRVYNGIDIIIGRIVFVFNGVYFIRADRFCTMFSDGLFRSRGRDVWLC